MVYVINKNGKPLMPCNPTKAKHLLKAGVAKVIRRGPFTIKLLWDCEENMQKIVAGMDTGSKTIGCAATANNKVVYQAEVQIRLDVSKKMKRRAMYRRNRRGRKCRYRPARWLNRMSMRREDRLAPSVKSKVDSHLKEKRFVESILPVSCWKVETAAFNIHKITDPTVTKTGYSEGGQKGYYNVKAFVLHRDLYECQHCKAKNCKLHVHHIVFRGNGGTNAPNNLITLCEDCHSDLHKRKFELKTKRSKTKHATEIGIIKSQLIKKFGGFTETFGYETKFKREKVLDLPKTHYYDAVAICCEEGELVEENNTVCYKKHVSSGDYQQTKGIRSNIRIPTGKLFGLKKFDLIETVKGVGFIKGKRSTGYFAIADIFNNVISSSINIKKNCRRLTARTTTLIEKSKAHSSAGQATAVSCA